MAVTINQSPTSPNVTGTNLVYALNSTSSSNAQFRYLTDIYESGSGEFITRIKTYPNLYGSGIIDVARELDDQLDYDYNWKITGSTQPVETVKTFDLRFGEEYAPSLSGSILQYTGSTNNYLKVFPGEVYKNEGSYNFNTSSFGEPLSNPYLTNAPYAYNNPTIELPLAGYHGLINSDDYFTAATFRDTFLTSSLIKVNAEKIVNGEFISRFQVDIPLLGISGSFATIGLGPKNLLEYSPTFSSSLAAGDITFVFTSDDFGGISYYINDKWDGVPYNNSNDLRYTGETFKQCSDEYTRFAFINQYGFWDYYNVYNPLRSNNQVDRSLYERSFVRYEDSIGSYNISNRGNTQYRTEYDKRYIITTDFIDKPTSQWLTELFESPEVFVQQNGDFVPINITNTSIRVNMNTAREKLFQYDIEFKYANQPQPR